MRTRKNRGGTRCPKGTKRYAPVGPDCYTQEYIDEWQRTRKDQSARRKAKKNIKPDEQLIEVDVEKPIAEEPMSEEIIEEPIKETSLIEDSIPVITEDEFKKYRLYKSPSPKADIWELRNPLYFDNPPRKFIFDKFVFTIMEKQTNKTHLKYIREQRPAVEHPVINPAEEPLETHHIEKPIEEQVEVPVEEHVKEQVEEEPLTYVPQKTNVGELTLDYKNRDGSITKLSDNSDFLYPTYDDPYFSSKIAQRQEFQDYKYDGTVTDIEKMSNKLCENAEFSLMPHQLFVKNFLSKNTPYNSILLYHGLGSGKTCSAIGIAEEARATMKQTGSTQRILMIASSNVQDNFKLQLFDERKLKRVLNNGAWTIESCIGNSLIKEINPTGDPEMKAERIVAQANAIINSSYSFMGYMQLANFIQYKILKPAESDLYNATQKKQIEIANIKKYFNNRLVIIDEVHNISTKTVAPLLLMVAKHAENLRFVLMSATPMYNSVEEIIYLTNLMNINDGRAPITVGQVFDTNGQMTDKGKTLLQNKLNGYVSYVRGENPYTFPFRLYPDVFEPMSTFKQKTYPTKSITGRDNLPVMKGMKDRIYLTNAGEKQREIYDFITAHSFQSNNQRNIFKTAAEDDDTALFNNMETFGYTKLQIPIQALIMTFPQKLDTEDVDDIGAFCKTMVGKDGMARAMKFKEERKKLDEETSIYMKHQYEYRKGFEGLFSLQGSLRLYSGKIAAICEKILTSTGIVMVYSQYIDGGIVPMALALEELGFSRYGSMQQYVKPLFKKGAAINQEPRDAITMELRPDFLKSRGGDGFKQAKYMILSGDKFFSQNNAEDIKYATNKANASGEQIRVILISRAASEGLDFKFIRQVHILDPWYNMNRVEQIVGRGVRNLSHCGLPFSERNVEIYQHATAGDTKEYADHYIYRYAENKAITIGKVTRLMKQISVDCVLNIGQNNFTVDELFKIAENKLIRVHPSSLKDTISFRVGDKSGTDACDYADSCDYVCLKDNGNKDTIRETFDKSTIEANIQRPIDKIKALFKSQKTVYHKDELAKYVQNDIQLNYVLTQLIEDPLETVEDMFGRQGRVVNRGPFYLYQPIEVTDKRSNAIENTNPVNFKHDVLSYAISDTLPKDDEANTIVQEADGSASPVSPTDAKIMEKGAEQILDELEAKYDIIVDPVAANLSAGETEWHIIYNSERGGKSLIQDYLIKDLGLTREEADMHAFTHMCDVLHYREKRILIEYLYANKPALDTAFLKQLRAYFDARKLEKAKSFGFLLSRITKGIIKNVFLLYENGQWMEEEPGDMVSYKQDIYDMLKKDVSLLNPILGFMGYFKGRGTTWSMVFKTKILSMGKNNKGAYLQNEGKAEILKKFNSIVKTKTYTMAEVEELSKIGLALVLEMAMRHLNAQGATKYVLTAEEALFNGVEGL